MDNDTKAKVKKSILDSYTLPENMTGEQAVATLNDMSQIADQPSAMMRGAVHNALTDKPIFQGLMKPANELPSGEAVAEAAGNKFNIQNPYALSAIETGAEMMDVPSPFQAAKRFNNVLGAINKIKKVRSPVKVGNLLMESRGSTAADMDIVNKLREKGLVPKDAVAIYPETSMDFSPNGPSDLLLNKKLRPR